MRGRAAAGSQQDGDDVSIVAVLGLVQSFLAARGIPAIDNREDLDAFEFWLAVAGLSIPWDPYRGNRASAEEHLRAAVVAGKTKAGFAEWWDDQIGTF
ncbi:hypothetical protein PTQ19_11825 [Microbacterium esteraromaticum]|uniref:hypothetical protein n=1 Tax=Microbacterium esteraromaticum TaxID=57043 RepID=UPI002367BC15|nr:hypothetical protein [Microbacterium esteraromaticum]WDH78200.1 hypothetical protein PTQ19_11825 [Microbacterium esteraromaticum]